MQITPRGLILSAERNSAKQTISARRQTFRLAERMKLYKSAHLHRKFRAFYCGCCSRASLISGCSASFLLTLSSASSARVCALEKQFANESASFIAVNTHTSSGGRAREKEAHRICIAIHIVSAKKRTHFVSHYSLHTHHKNEFRQRHYSDIIVGTQAASSSRSPLLF
jgi:hypothetical protein